MIVLGAFITKSLTVSNILESPDGAIGAGGADKGGCAIFNIYYIYYMLKKQIY
jgi:hypothetical protein